MAPPVKILNGSPTERSHVNFRFSDLQDEQQRILVGIGLIALGLGGVCLYVISACIPLAILSGLFLVLVGVGILIMELRADRVLPGLNLSPADLGAAMVNSYKEVMTRYVFMLALPGRLTGADVLAILRQYHAEQQQRANASSPALAPAARVSAPAASSTNGAINVNGTADAVGDFDKAVRWLRQPRLQLGIEAQLRLRGLYMQAVFGDADVASSSSTRNPAAGADAIVARHGKSFASMLMEDWRAHRGIPSSAARGCLPAALAEADPVFAAAHPMVLHVNGCGAASSPSTMGDVALELLERRLPGLRLEALVRRLCGAFSAAAAAAAVALLRAALAAQRRRPPRSPRFAGQWALARSWPVAGAIVSAASSLYLLAVARGLPPWVWLLLLRLRRRLRLAKVVAAMPANSPHGAKAGAAAARLRQRLRGMLVPGVSHSIFANDP